jgi:site-specific DNA-methyltransferase (adenine-specific)
MYLLPSVASGPITVDVVHHTDLLTLCAALPARSVDMILADLPYGTTACEWDEVIPFEPMWAAFERVIKPRGAIVLTASQPFTSRLVCSNIAWFRYVLVWEKSNGTNFMNSPFQPLKVHEDINVFSPAASSYSTRGSMAYYPIKEVGKPYATTNKQGLHQFHSSPAGVTSINLGWRYPRSILRFNEERGLHPTQKPVALFEYLIRTYTRPGEVVLDPVCGSGTTAIACRNTGRRWICGDKELKYVTVAKERLAQPYTLSLPTIDAPTPAAVQAALL